jgi:hypothetical protein
MDAAAIAKVAFTSEDRVRDVIRAGRLVQQRPARKRESRLRKRIVYDASTDSGDLYESEIHAICLTVETAREIYLP